MKDDLTLIEKYFDQGLSPQESAEFDQRMNGESFSDLVASETVRLAGRQKIKAELINFDKQLKNNKQKGKIKNILLWIVVAVICGFAALYLFTPSPKQSDPAQIYATHFTPYPNVLESRSLGNDPNDIFRQAMIAYDNQSYAEASKFFNMMDINADTTEDMQRFYAAMTFMASNDIDKSIPILTEISTDPNLVLAVEAKWYLALCYIKRNERSKADVLLNDLQSAFRNYKPELVKSILKN